MTAISRKWDLLPHAIGLIECELQLTENEAFQTLKGLIVDERVTAQGPWPRGGINGNPRPNGRAHRLPAESFNYAVLTSDDGGVTLLDALVAIPWVEINMDELRQVLIAHAQPTPTEPATTAPSENEEANKPPAKKLGRRVGTGLDNQDKPLLAQMQSLIENKKASSTTKAAEMIPDSDLPGHGTPESKRSRLVKKFNRGAENN